MTQDPKTRRAAELLLAVRHGSAPIAGLGEAAPADEAGAWAIQRAVLAGMGGAIGGYKCATPPGKAPSGALMPAAGIHASPWHWPVPAGTKVGIETEVAFRMARALPPRGTPWTQAEVMDAVEACFPAIELVLTRYADPKAVSPMEAVADNVAHGGLVFGAPVPNWRSLDLNDLAVTQSCGGLMQVERRGSNPAGDPLPSLTRFANHLHAFGLQLEAGQVVTTGSWTGMLWVEGGQRVVGAFAELGEVIVDLD